MLQPYELRVGNWVNKGNEYFQITLFGEANLIFSRDDFNQLKGYEIEECEAIPLTPETLIKAGFRVCHDFINKNNGVRYVYIKLSGSGIINFF